MYPIPGSDQRMDEFKYLAFLSFTAKHFKKWSKKSKVIFFTVIFIIIAVIAFWVFWSFVAENPAVTVLPSGNSGNAYFSSEQAKDEALAKQLLENRIIKVYSIGKAFSGSAIELVLHTNGTVNEEELAKSVAEKILQSASKGRSEVTIKPLRFANGSVVCYSSIIQTKGKAQKVKFVFTEIPYKGTGKAGGNYYCGALVMPTGLFAKAEVEASVAPPITVRKKSLNINNVGLATLFEGHPTVADNTIYLYDVQEVTVKGTGMDVFYARGALVQDFLNNLLHSTPQRIAFP